VQANAWEGCGTVCAVGLRQKTKEALADGWQAGKRRTNPPALGQSGEVFQAASRRQSDGCFFDISHRLPDPGVVLPGALQSRALRGRKTPGRRAPPKEPDVPQAHARPRARSAGREQRNVLLKATAKASSSQRSTGTFAGAHGIFLCFACLRLRFMLVREVNAPGGSRNSRNCFRRGFCRPVWFAAVA